MHVDTVYTVTNLFVVWLGVALLVHGVQMMYDSGYRPPKTPAGFVMAMLWIVGGGALASAWLTHRCSRCVDQTCNGKPRWSTTRLLGNGLILLAAAGIGVMGTFMTYLHPYRLGPCDCTTSEWGPNCEPCLCDHGVCDSGTYGSGRCSCDDGWAGDYCDRCDARHTGDDCDDCKTGYDPNTNCQTCARQYDGEECDICARGWREWQNYSALFPNVISDDNRHLCDECAPNHFGYNCRPCPWGNDVPALTLTQNAPLTRGTRVVDVSARTGTVEQMQIYQDEAWIPSFDYDKQQFAPLTETRVKIRYDYTHQLSEWTTLSEIRGVQCNNRGTCEDDDRHQAQTPDWQDTCTYDPLGNNDNGQCTSDEDCTVSENCQGTCIGELPVPILWSVQKSGSPCKSDADCQVPNIVVDEFNTTYEGGRCVTRVCCAESRHGSGNCDCDPQYFGTEDQPDGQKPHYKKSPACDFCPGYDWLTEEPTTICSGGKGTCQAGYSRTGDYLSMRCACGTTAENDLQIAWSGELCQAGDWDEDNEYDICASGYWGPDCTQCPGGFGLRACSGHGVCQGSGTNSGTGQCICDVGSPRATAWMLAPYVKRYAAETVGLDATGASSTCNECAPNHYGDECYQCPGTDSITPSQLSDIFQPPFSYTLLGQSSAQPAPLCHPQKPTMCWISCGRGGWCDWGRKGDGTCTCWSNRRQNSDTWNPLDNVCIGNDRYTSAPEDYAGFGEQCPSYGRCSGGDASRHTTDTCGAPEYVGTDKDLTQTIADTGWIPSDDWSGTPTTCPGTQECYPWHAINWAPERNTCERDP